MADFSLFSSIGEILTHGADTSTSGGTTITSGTADAKGSWVEMVASTDEMANGLIIHVPIVNNAGGTITFLFDLGIGSAENEEVLVPNMHLAAAQGVGLNAFVWHIPIQIAAGERLALRQQNPSTSNTFDALIYEMIPNLLATTGAGFVTSYGDDTANSAGLSIDPGGTANTKGSWIEIISSSDELAGFFLSLTQGANSGTALAGFLFDIGIGSAGNEEIIVADIAAETTTSETYNFLAATYPIRIPSGTRISARSQCTITQPSDRLSDMVFHGVR